MASTKFPYPGLSESQLAQSRAQYGYNRVEELKPNRIVEFLKSVWDEPMVMLLVVASTLYFILGETTEGSFLAVATLLVFSISYWQEQRSRKALDALKKLSRPNSKVIRDGVETEIPGDEVAVGDLLIAEEGSLIAADGDIIQSNDFSVNESALTGESVAVEKSVDTDNRSVYQGTFVVSGSAIIEVRHIGVHTALGRIGSSLKEVKAEKSPLQMQIQSFVKRMALTGIAIFLLICVVRIAVTGLVIQSLLEALTIAMSIIPEEIPVAFATFMALGAWRLGQLGIIVKKSTTVETLGSASVICVDKTGTLTKNEMVVHRVYVHETRKTVDRNAMSHAAEVITMAMWASETQPFDTMEQEIHRIYGATTAHDQRTEFSLVHEYPLGGRPPMMTHVFQNSQKQRIIAAKGAPEAIVRQSVLSDNDKAEVLRALDVLTAQGYRVLGVGQVMNTDVLPEKQEAFSFRFLGFIAFFDPPKENVRSVLEKFYEAGVSVRIITGDNERTTAVVAREIGFRGGDHTIIGEELVKLSGDKFDDVVRSTYIFARMFPEAKLKIIESLKRQGFVVGMTGDGINDGPALKAAHIGIAMGKGTEVAKDAAALVLNDDNLEKMVDAIAMGRKIYNNLKKGIQYIIAVHTPIILIVFVPLTLGWMYGSLLTPVHVIFLELIMGPTCSVVYENEPLESNLMQLKPRSPGISLFSLKELLICLIQGLAITVGLFAVYQYAASQHYAAGEARAMIFITLMTANIFLTLVNRSYHYSLFRTIRNPNPLVPLVIGVSLSLVGVVFAVPAMRNLFDVSVLPFKDVAWCVATAAITVLWIEVVKLFRARKTT